VRLGFAPDDATDLLEAAKRARSSPASLARIDELAARLRANIGVLDDASRPTPWTGYDDASDPLGSGVTALLSLLASADEVIGYLRGRGVPEPVTWRSLADVGHQARVHRATYGEFGLHTYDWLRVVWSGGFAWLGRLQFNLQPRRLPGGEPGWVLSTHIPRTGRLEPAAVDASFAAARAFFGQHFGDYPTDPRVGDLHCWSWLLDPVLAAALPPASNMAQFQRRWRLSGPPVQADADALFFTFLRRGAVDLATLPRDTTLQRVIIDRLQAGEHWHSWPGLIGEAR
jgi:hypothetical protein